MTKQVMTEITGINNITAGKWYDCTDGLTHRSARITKDNGKDALILYEGCAFLDGGNWNVREKPAVLDVKVGDKIISDGTEYPRSVPKGTVMVVTAVHEKYVYASIVG